MLWLMMIYKKKIFIKEIRKATGHSESNDFKYKLFEVKIADQNFDLRTFIVEIGRHFAYHRAKCFSY